MPVQSRAFDSHGINVEFRKAVYPYARIDTIDLNPEVTSMSWSTVAPGGFQTCQIGYDNYAVAPDGATVKFSAIPTNTLMVPHFCLVTVRAGEHKVFEGRVVRRDLGIEGVKSFQAKGLGVTATNDKTFKAPSDITEYNTAQVIQIILAQCTNNLIAPGPPDVWIDPGTGTHILSEFNGRQGSSIIDGLITANGLDFNVWESNTNFQPRAYSPAQLIPRVAPAVPKYIISWDGGISNWVEISEESYNRVTVTYTDGDTGAANQTTDEYVDTSLPDLYGIERSITIDAGSTCQACANAFAQNYLDGHKLPTVQCTVSRNAFRGLEMQGGVEQPPHLVRAGEWIKIANYPTLLPIVRTEFNASTGELSLEIGAYAPSYQNMIHTLHKAHCTISAGSNLNSGSRA